MSSLRPPYIYTEPTRLSCSVASRPPAARAWGTLEKRKAATTFEKELINERQDLGAKGLLLFNGALLLWAR